MCPIPDDLVPLLDVSPVEVRNLPAKNVPVDLADEPWTVAHDRVTFQVKTPGVKLVVLLGNGSFLVENDECALWFTENVELFDGPTDDCEDMLLVRLFILDRINCSSHLNNSYISFSCVTSLDEVQRIIQGGSQCSNTIVVNVADLHHLLHSTGNPTDLLARSDLENFTPAIGSACRVFKVSQPWDLFSNTHHVVDT
ncbi:hypothetical protein OGAPHI_001831 [Ogataea philodendri]|uniref:Uncharacterized protein n=1 Tax=Ogataea philodendri TaxID=1378263 RepID=A0A9P8PA31_9ASCO|nr:uncharacterized protein OGAPHI_001831 [Ogataea philodendri]KAH3668077.1 hypothetical protein OGAPHI_001831 [Ogataea philodendri]